MSDTRMPLQIGPLPRVAGPLPSGGRGGVGGWVKVLCGSLLGAFVAIVVMEKRLEAELAVRPPVVVADYQMFVSALGEGGQPEVLKILADRYTARAEQLASQGVLVLRSELLVGRTPLAGVPQDPRERDLLQAMRRALPPASAGADAVALQGRTPLQAGAPQQTGAPLQPGAPQQTEPRLKGGSPMQTGSPLQGGPQPGSASVEAWRAEPGMGRDAEALAAALRGLTGEK
jgi:hypothetical protein